MKSAAHRAVMSEKKAKNIARKQTVPVKPTSSRVAECKKRDENEGKRGRNLTKGRQLFCVQCDDVLSKMSKRGRHVLKHLAINYLIDPFSCVYCDYTLFRSDYMKLHVRKQHPDKPLIFDNKLNDPVIGQLYKEIGKKCFGEFFRTSKRFGSLSVSREEHSKDEPSFDLAGVNMEGVENESPDSVPLSSAVELKLDNDEMIFNVW